MQLRQGMEGLFQRNLERSPAPLVYCTVFGGDFDTIAGGAQFDVEGWGLLQATLSREGVGHNVDQKTRFVARLAGNLESFLGARLVGCAGEVGTHLGYRLSGCGESDALAVGSEGTTLELDVIAPPLLV